MQVPSVDHRAAGYTPNNPDLNDPGVANRVPGFSFAFRSYVDSASQQIHNGSAALRVPTSLWQRLFQITRYWPDRTPRLLTSHRQLRLDTQRMIYDDSEQYKRRKEIEERAKQVHPKIANVQFGVWYRRPDALQSHGRTFSIEYERDLLRDGVASIDLIHERSLIRINITRRTNKEMNYFIIVKFSSIRNLGVGYDRVGQPFIIFDLHTPPSFELESIRAPDGTERRWRFKTNDRLSAFDDAHARVAPYAHHLRVVLADRDDLPKLEELLRIAQGNCRPIRVSNVDASAQGFFSNRYIHDVYCWIKTMDWKNAFQIEAYLRCGLLNTHELLFTLQKPIENLIRDYGDDASELLRLFSVALRMRHMDETPSACLAHLRAEHPTIKPLRPERGQFLCHHVVITPTRMLLEGPYTLRSNRVIRHYQNHDPTLVERFVRVEFRDEDNLAFRWDGDVDGTWFLRQRVGGILREGFELGGRAFEFLAYSMGALREHAVWFVAPFRDPVEGYVNADMIRASLGDFSGLVRTPSKYAARIAQAFTPTDPAVKIRRDQWEEQDDLGPHTDGAGTISPELADMIWEERCRTTGKPGKDCVKPSAYQVRFLGYKGVVVVDHRLEGIKMRLRASQRKFLVHDVEVAELEIVRSFDHPDPAHLNKPTVIALEGLGVKKDTFMDIQGAVKAQVYSVGNSLEGLAGLLKSYDIGGAFHLALILEWLTKLSLGLKETFNQRAFENAFLGRVLRGSAYHILRELKYRARIPVAGSYRLVGVADEGRAYINEGADPCGVFTLREGFIYVCVQEAVDKEPVYLKGPCLISRSPVIHPGDMQRVYAVGKPPEDKICFFRDLKNVVVLSAVGDRSLASCLARGDLDGDTYDIYFGNPELLPTVRVAPANYPPSEVWTLGEGSSDVTVEHIHDFIVEFMNSDTIGLLADRHSLIVDQTKDGVFDKRCLELSRLCGIAMDYATNGKRVEINDVPKPLAKSRPDWHCPEVTGARQVDYYVSDRALGYLYRNIDMQGPNELLPIPSLREVAPLDDAISRTVASLVQIALNATVEGPWAENTRVENLHTRYASEMRYICVTHSPVGSPDVCLTEEEVVLGTILAKSTQPRWRADRAYRMTMHTETLLRDLRGQIVNTSLGLGDGLRDAWAVWGWAQYHREKPFIQSFSLITLGLVFDLLQRLGVKPDSVSVL